MVGPSGAGKDTPLIIDEPEAHLDSSLVANFLVGLVKRKKLERQLIFATHNANFVVNGDAELIHCMSIEAGSRQCVGRLAPRSRPRFNRGECYKSGSLLFSARSAE